MTAAKDQGPTSSDVERMREALEELVNAAAHDLSMNQSDNEEGCGWWSVRCENAIRAARALLSLSRERETCSAARSEHQSAGRDSVLEEAAKVADEAMANYEPGGWGEAACESIAFRIRSLKQEGGGNG